MEKVIMGGLYLLDETGVIISQHKRNPGKKISKRIDRAGYYTVRMSSNGTTKTYLLHRILAICFIANPDNKPFVNHINGNKLDYRLCNLEWSSHSENITHAFKTGLIHIPEVKKIKVIDICTGRRFNSIKEAAVYNSIPYSSCKNILRGIRPNETCLRLAV